MGSWEGLYQSPNLPSLCKQTSKASYLGTENSSLQRPRIHISINQLVKSTRTLGKTIMPCCSALQLQEVKMELIKARIMWAKGRNQYKKLNCYVERDNDRPVSSYSESKHMIPGRAARTGKINPRRPQQEFVMMFL